MPQSGPSREELENYFKNSRPYFDELAKHYYETDRDYYNKYIAPFYSPFGAILPVKKGTGSRITVLAAMILVGVIGAAVAFFIALAPETDSPREQKQIEDVREKSDIEADEKTKSKDTASVKKKKLSDYEKGIDYYESGDYDNAERYFKKVPVTDKNYGDAQQKIVEMKVEKMTGKYKRYIKPAPVERKR
jgi:tetratricopeptide (TPR) repeat protein